MPRWSLQRGAGKGFKFLIWPQRESSRAAEGNAARDDRLEERKIGEGAPPGRRRFPCEPEPHISRPVEGLVATRIRADDTGVLRGQESEVVDTWVRRPPTSGERVPQRPPRQFHWNPLRLGAQGPKAQVDGRASESREFLVPRAEVASRLLSP